MNFKKSVIIFSVCMKSVVCAFSTYNISSFDLEFIQDLEGSQATCINNKGEVCGGLFVGGANIHHSAFIWSKERGLVELFPNQAFPPNDFNDSMQIVGSIPQANDPPRGYIWSLEQGFIDLRSFMVNGINNDGVMTGIYKPTRNDSNTAYIKYPLEVHHRSLNLQKLMSLNKIYKAHDYSEFVTAINNKNEVIGCLNFRGYKLTNKYSQVEDFHAHGFLWTSQETCVDFGAHMIPQAINDLSQVVLVSNFSGKGDSWLWENEKIIELWDGGFAQAINNEQVIVGARDNNAVIWENGQLKDLIGLVNNTDGWDKLTMALDINDRGEIVGRGVYRGKQTAFLLSPFEE